MRFSILLILLALAYKAYAINYSAEALKDEVINLPDAPNVPFKMFSGYIPVNDKGRKLFYFFAEADPSIEQEYKNNLIFWTNGGPGCSGLLSFTENNIFSPLKNNSLIPREFSWNKMGNFLAIEQPAGVGFSQAEGPISFNLENVAADNLAFIRGFLNRFDSYKNHKLYLTSESYGGHYLPTLSKAIVDKAPEINFKGFAVGNPLVYLQYRDFAELQAYYSRRLIPKKEWDSYIKAGCEPDVTQGMPNPPKPLPSICSTMQSSFSRYIRNIDPYAMDFPTCQSSSNKPGYLQTIYNTFKGIKNNTLLNDYFPKYYEPCEENYLTSYLNRRDVQKALHVEGNPRWSSCAGIDFSDHDMNESMVSVYQYLRTKKPDIKMLVYSGTDDAVCATTEAEMAFETHFNVKEQWKPWLLEKQLGGFTVKFDVLDFITIHGAGHMAPSTRPHQTFSAIKNFLSDSYK